MPSGSGFPIKDGSSTGGRIRRIARRPTPARGSPLPQFDVRVTRELAHRRFVVSVVRQALRLVSLHALDAVAVVGAAITAAALTETQAVTAILPSLVAFVLIGLNVQGSYRAGDARRDGQRLFFGVVIALLLAALPSTIQAAEPLRQSFLALFGITTVVLLVIERRIVDAIVHAAYVRGIGLRRALIVARRDEYRHVLAHIAPHQVGRPAEDQVIVGFVSPETLPDPDALAALPDLEHLLDQHDVSELIVASTLRGETLTEVAEVCFVRGVRVLVLPAAGASRSLWAEPTRVGKLPAYQLHPTRLELPSLIVKRAADLVLAGLGLAVALPLMLFIAVAIKVESRGPVFFRQRRVGLGGRHFMMWKFRTMRRDAESRLEEVAHLNAYGDGRLFKLARDPRVTRVGRLLRRFSLDELPQLFNVMAGDMSLVGPRPPLPAEVESYEPRHMVRLSVVPGLTGPWQVSGRNLITDFEEVVRLERAYIERWSLRHDIEIMLRTIFVVLSGRGAY